MYITDKTCVSVAFLTASPTLFLSNSLIRTENEGSKKIVITNPQPGERLTRSPGWVETETLYSVENSFSVSNYKTVTVKSKEN